MFVANEVPHKTRGELRMIKASASIRSAPEWAEQLRDKTKREEWTTHVKETFALTDKEIEYVFEELEYYALLKASGRDGEELGAVDNVWVTDTGNDKELEKQVVTDAIHPRGQRAVFDKEAILKPEMLSPEELIELVEEGGQVPEEYLKFVSAHNEAPVK
ncbi:hypothetical protein H4S04_008996, partial [Coemansia sp. S16]